MFFKIVIKNMKYNIKNYILFFIGNMIGVTTFFVFWGIYSVVKSSASNSINLEDTLVEIIISVLVITIFATALMIYSLMNYIKLKFRDYALFIILGAKKKIIYTMIGLEYLFGWGISLVSGVLMGKIIFSFVQKIWHNLFPMYISYTKIGLDTYLNACKVSCLIMALVFVFVLVWNDNCGISSIIATDSIKERKPQSIYWSVFIVLGIGILCLSYFSYQSSMSWGYIFSHLEWIFGGFLILMFGGGICLEEIHKHTKFYDKNILKLNRLYSKYQTNMLILLMLLSVHFVAMGYCVTNITTLLPISRYEEKYPYQAIWFNRKNNQDIKICGNLCEEYQVSVKNIPIIRVSSYGNELIGISEDTYEKLTGEKISLKNKEIVYITSEYRTGNRGGVDTTKGGFDYGKKGFTWLAMGSYTSKLKEYVDPGTNNILPSHDKKHLYKLKKTESRNLFGKYRMNNEAENVIVFSNKYFKLQRLKMQKKEYEPTTLSLFKIPDSKEKIVLKELNQYIKQHNIKDFGLTDTPQSTFYITKEFVKNIKKGEIFKITNKIFIMFSMLINGFFVFAIKTIAETPYYQRQWKFLKCMGIRKKIWNETINMEIKILSCISIIAALVLSLGYLIINFIVDKKSGIIYGNTVWKAWILMVCIYVSIEYSIRKIFTIYICKKIVREV